MPRVRGLIHAPGFAAADSPHRDASFSLRLGLLSMRILAEQPIFASILLGALGISLLYVWSKGLHRSVGIAGLVFLLLIPVAWLISFAIETEEETIAKLIKKMATHVEANEIDEALTAVHPDLLPTANRARGELSRYEFSRARVSGFDRIRVLRDREPMEAAVDLAVSVRVTGNGATNTTVPRRLLLRLEKTSEGWKIVDYEHRPLVGPNDGFSTRGQTNWDDYFRAQP